MQLTVEKKKKKKKKKKKCFFFLWRLQTTDLHNGLFVQLIKFIWITHNKVVNNKIQIKN